MGRFFTGVPIRAALGATLVVAIALVATGFALLHLLEKDLADKADAQAAAVAARASAELKAGTDPQRVTNRGVPVKIEDPTGKLVAASKNLDTMNVSDPAPVKKTAASAPPAFSDPVPVPVPKTAPPAPVEKASDPQYRWAATVTSEVSGKPVVIFVATSLETERSTVRTVRLGMIGGLPILLLLVGVLTWLVAHRALRPVAVAVDRQRRFVADASHELRNPIASLRTQLEIAVEHPQLLDLEGIVADTVRLQSLAADLLLLARLDADHSIPAGEPVNLAELIGEQGEVWVEGSAGQLTRVIENLQTNARRHARSIVRTSIRLERDKAILEVADDGPGIAETERDRVFERFVRLDDARTRDEGGAGLGLAIAREIATHHRGTLTAHDNPTGGALFRLTLPAKT
ncbi:two-component sensor histidine kinase [Kribbella antibiotica]|uniref:histidine kinase n=1 Tax=Kribbella antibiotica TaxID=190195 RepID=A0A4R4Z9C6_9ACTN|nr:ATP-binding protein [Kribbella antibiotica]TDD53854.1 two-component sensor histidine kinase [Kribbella antibiotica]